MTKRVIIDITPCKGNWTVFIREKIRTKTKSIAIGIAKHIAEYLQPSQIYLKNRKGVVKKEWVYPFIFIPEKSDLLKRIKRQRYCK